jgi:hypothetical protein
VRNRISQTWVARILIGFVLLINVQSALVFWLKPSQFAPAYELTGIPGHAAIRGFAILFLMWNVPYVVAFINPVKYRVSLYEAITMQTLGLVGETIIFWTLPTGHLTLKESIWRFILFDGAGVIALMLVIWITRKNQRK